MRNTCYQFRTIGTSVPYYYYCDTGETKWGYDPNYKIFEPNEGMYRPPPEIPANVEENFNFSTSYTTFRRKTVSNLNNERKKKIDNIQDTGKIQQFIPSNDYQIPLSFMKVPFFPSDLFILMDCQTLYNYLVNSMNLDNFYEKGVKKGKKLDVEEIFIPGPKTLRGPILKFTKPSNIVINLSKSCRNFIHKSEYLDYSRIYSIFRLIDGNPSLLPEAIVFLIIETNSKNVTVKIKNAWSLLLILISKYDLHNIKNDSFDTIRVLRSYVAIVASTKNVSPQIINPAMLCLLRLSCINNKMNVPYNEDNPQEYFFKCQTSRQYFGVSLAEIIYKERVFNRNHKNMARIQQTGGRSMINLLAQPTSSSNLTLSAHRDLSTISLKYSNNFNDSMNFAGSPSHNFNQNININQTINFNQSINFNLSTSSLFTTTNNGIDNNTGAICIELEDKEDKILLVPNVLLNLIERLKEVNVFHIKNVFLTKCNSKTEKLKAIHELNISGRLDPDINNVFTITSLVKYFFKQLQQPLIPLKVVKEKLDPQIEWFKCIRIANLLPNENKDTLMYLIGFLQELVKYKNETWMDASKLSKIFANCLIRDVTGAQDVRKNQRLIDSTTRFLNCLIENWKTDDVYNIE